jgi:hypothetical protein
MHPARTIPAIGRNHDLVLEAPAPRLCNQGVELARRIEQDQRHAIPDPRRGPFGDLEGRVHFLAGAAEDGRFRVFTGDDVTR